MQKMSRMIVPCRMRITGVDGTWKLEPEQTGRGAACSCRWREAHGLALDGYAVARQMRGGTTSLITVRLHRAQVDR